MILHTVATETCFFVSGDALEDRNIFEYVYNGLRLSGKTVVPAPFVRDSIAAPEYVNLRRLKLG